MCATNAVEDNAFAGEAMNFFHEVDVLVINRDTAQIGSDRRP